MRVEGAGAARGFIPAREIDESDRTANAALRALRWLGVGVLNIFPERAIILIRHGTVFDRANPPVSPELQKMLLSSGYEEMIVWALQEIGVNERASVIRNTLDIVAEGTTGYEKLMMIHAIVKIPPEKREAVVRGAKALISERMDSPQKIAIVAGIAEVLAPIFTEPLRSGKVDLLIQTVRLNPEMSTRQIKRELTKQLSDSRSYVGRNTVESAESG